MFARPVAIIKIYIFAKKLLKIRYCLYILIKRYGAVQNNDQCKSFSSPFAPESLS